LFGRVENSPSKSGIADDYTWRLAVTVVALIGTTVAIAGARTQDNTPNSSVREEAMLKELARAQKKGAQNTYLPLEYLAAFYEQQKQWAKAAQHYSQLVTLWTRAAGPDAVGTARFEDREAMSLARLGEHAKAEELLSHALSMLRKAPEIDVVSRALVQADLGEIFA